VGTSQWPEWFGQKGWNEGFLSKNKELQWKKNPLLKLDKIFCNQKSCKQLDMGKPKLSELVIFQ